MCKMAISPFVRPFGIAAAILGIVQGVVWLILTLISILIYFEAWTPKPNTKTYGGLLSNTIVGVYLFKNGMTIGDLYIVPDTFIIWTILYLIISLCWTVFSSYQLWVIVSLEENLKLLKKACLCWGSWTLIISMCDLIFASLLASDYNFVVQATNKLTTSASKENYIIILACGVVMTLAARGFILWIVNVTFSIIMMKLSLDIPKKISENDNSSNIISAFANTNASRTWEPDKPMDKPNFTRSNSFISSKSFGTFQGLPRLPPVQSTNEPLANLARTYSTRPVTNSARPGSNNSSLYPYPSSPSLPDYSGPMAPFPRPPLKSALKNRAQPTYG